MSTANGSYKIPPAIWQAAIRDTPNGVLFFTADYQLIFANQAAAALLELPLPLPENADIRTLTGSLNLLSVDKDGFKSYTMNWKGETLHYRLIPMNDTSEGFGYAMILMESAEVLHSKSELAAAWKLTSEMEEILEGSFDGILVTDGEGNVQFVNSSYERVAAIPKKQLEGRNMRALINPV